MYTPNNLGELTCRDLELAEVPKTLCEDFSRIFHLDLRNNLLKTIENSVVFKLVNLKVLDLRSNRIEFITDEIGYLWNLRDLRLDNNHLTLLPLQLFQLQSLQILSISKNYLSTFQDLLYKLRKLSYFNISQNHIKIVPESILKLRRLTHVYLQKNSFTYIPTGLFNMNLEELGLDWFDYTDPVLTYSHMPKPFPITSDKVTFIDFLKCFNAAYESTEFLFKSINKGDTGIVASLIAADIDVNCFDSDGHSPLVVSIKQDKFDICKMLIEAGGSFNYGAGSYGSVLHIAVYKCELWLVEIILQTGVDVNMIDAEGNTPLHILMGVFSKQKYKCKRIGELIMMKRPLVNFFNYENWTPIHIASRKGFSAGIKWAIRQNQILKEANREIFDVDIRGGSLNWVPLHLASHSNDFKSIELLINAGAKIYKANDEGKTPKDTSKGNIAIYKYLFRLERKHRQLTISKAKLKKMPDFSNLSEEISSSATLYKNYQSLYNLFLRENFKEISEAAVRTQETIISADAVYLLNKAKDKHKYKASVNSIEKNQIFQLEKINFCTDCPVDAKIVESIGPKLKQIQSNIISK